MSFIGFAAKKSQLATPKCDYATTTAFFMLDFYSEDYSIILPDFY